MGGYDYFGDVRTVDVTIRRLREKIEDDPSHPEYIVTRRVRWSSSNNMVEVETNEVAKTTTIPSILNL